MSVPSTEWTPGPWQSCGKPGESPRGWPPALQSNGRGSSASWSSGERYTPSLSPLQVLHRKDCLLYTSDAADDM
eukprot:2245404-Alexandrium_andersonii.AAC.1